MSVPDLLLLVLRLFHALAAMIWLGGGFYYLVAVIPATRSSEAESREFAGRAQYFYGEWAQAATLVMLATGVILAFDALSEGQGGLKYAGLLGLKVVAAVAAFALVLNRRRGEPSRTDLVVGLGIIAFALGVIISSVWE